MGLSLCQKAIRLVVATGFLLDPTKLFDQVDRKIIRNRRVGIERGVMTVELVCKRKFGSHLLASGSQGGRAANQIRATARMVQVRSRWSLTW